MTSNQNGMGLVASFLSLAIVCILHVAILHLFSTVSSRRSADGTSQGQQTVHPTPLIGVTSESSDAVEVTSERPSEHEIPSASLHDRIQLVPRKGTAGKLSQDEVITTILATFLREEIYVSPKYEKTYFLKDEGHEIITRLLSELSLAVSRKDLVGRDSNDDIVYAQERITRVNYVICTKPKKILREIYVGKHGELASTQSGLEPFIAARKDSAHPIVVRSLEPDPDQNPQPSSDRGPTIATGSSTSRIQGSDPIVAPEIGVRDIREHLRRNPHLFAIRSLFQLVPYYPPLISQNDKEGANENLAEFSQDLLDMHPGQESEVKLLQRLAHTPAFTSQLPGKIAQIVSIPAVVRRNDVVVMYERLGTAWWWATFARMWAHSSTTVAYQNTLSALRGILVAGLTTRLLYTFFGRLGPRLHVPLEYSSYLLERGRLELAVETIEYGKALIWSEMFGLHSSMGRLRSVNPKLADRLVHFTEGLEAIETSGTQLEEDADSDAFTLAFEKLQELLKGRQEVFQEIRALPGFANFMKDIPFRTLRNAAAKGPIIIINHCHWRCDILIILHDSPPSLIPTNEGFYELASNLESRLKDARRYGLDSSQYDTVLRDTLAELYELVGRPVISRLQDLGIQEQSRVWWYPTSVFCSLPLHAMGPVSLTNRHERYFSDMYVCSYTPTLGALIQSRGSPALNPDPQCSLLLVAQPEDTLPGVRGEMKMIQRLQMAVTTLSSAEVTKTAVLEDLQNHTIAHFACHGNRGEEGPLESAIRLPGGGRLTLRDIVNSQAQLPLGEVVFLSTCHTAESTDFGDPTEGLNIAAAMQYQVFRSVIGTMWEMADLDGRVISKPFYRYLLAHRDESHGVTLGERSARALQKAVRVIRRKKGVPLERWVNWVHYGA
ncbi:CHAT domain-containing protein [Lactarius pseudohatsudake]|nr:CHAT domain-containing protein [Lactarius pseudohatsudake]